MLRSIFLLVKGCAVCLCKGCAAFIYIYIYQPSLRIQNSRLWGLLTLNPWAHFGSWGSLWALESTSEPWANVGPRVSICINGSPLGPFGLTLGPSELASGPVAHFGPMCPLWALEPSFGPRANLGPFGFICAHLGPFCTYMYIYIYTY